MVCMLGMHKVLGLIYTKNKNKTTKKQKQNKQTQKADWLEGGSKKKQAWVATITALCLGGVKVT